MHELSFEEKYDLIGNQDPQNEGIFITCVTSTGIFCRPSCRARKPLSKNVLFVENSQEAMRSGFRPCKLCKPMEREGETPDNIKALIKELNADPSLRLKDWDLKQRGFEPSYLRRWFQKHHNMTFHCYQRMMRINSAYNQIKGGNSVTNSAFGVGYDSLSGFNDGYKAIFGEAPKEIKHQNVINIHRFTTKLGPMFVAATDKGICLLEFTDRRMLEKELKDIRNKLKAVILPGVNAHIEQAMAEIELYYEGKLKEFTVSLDAPASEFQKTVWDALQTIPYGETRSYKKQAEAIGNPNAVRAVANANGANRISIIIPCHRVLGADGSLTGYGGGLKRKQFLLDHEKENRAD